MTKEQKALQIEVSNFGPITKGKVCTKPLTIFTGPSNTGKSYLALLLYTFLKVRISKNSTNFSKLKEDMHIIKFDQFLKLIEEKKLNYNTFSKLLLECVDHKQLQNFIQKYFYKRLTIWRNQIDRCIAPLSQLIRSSDLSKSKTLEIILNDFLKIVQNKANTQQDIISDPQWLKSIVKRYTSDKSPLTEYLLMERFANNFLEEQFLKLICNDREYQTKILYKIASHHKDVLCDLLDKEFSNIDRFHPYSLDAYYFPAARTGLMKTHKLIVSNAISQLSESNRDVTLGGDITDFLNKLTHIKTGEVKRRSFKGTNYVDESDDALDYLEMTNVLDIQKIADNLEKNLLKGLIEVKYNPVEYPDFVYIKDNLEISMLNASSMVTELAPIVLFLKHYVKLGDTLIIEEPEAGLHPRAQKDMAGVLVALIKAGVNIVITTHSETLVQEISNYRMSEPISKEKRKEIIGSALSLSENELAVYNFKRNGKDVIIEDVPFDKEDGISIKDHNEVSTELYDQTTDVYDESHKDESKSSA